MTLGIPTGEETSVPPVSGFTGLNSLRRKAILIYSVRETSDNERLMVLPSMNFLCNGNISRWTFWARRQGGGGQYPRFQLWRPNGTDRYERVYESSTDSSRFTTEANSGLTINVPPAPIPVQAGDVLGVYQPGNRRGDRRLSVIHVNVPDDFGHVNFVGGTDVAEFNTGELSAFNDFPLVAVNTSKNQMFISGGLC